MMLFKLSVKNIRKSVKDYTIYFLTLVLGVSIFYMFNSLDSQEAMLEVSKSTRNIVVLMIDMLSMVSVFVAITLGFLIVYANNFLIKRRKKEFGLYMTLGMGKWQISRILLVETFIIGLMSLAVGLIVGVFGSQLMSVLVAKLFEADMTEFQFVFSKAACLKTCLYFGVMYMVVMFSNVFSISKYKLIDLLTAVKKNEKVKMKNPVLCVIVFLLSVGMLGWAYYTVTAGLESMESRTELFSAIVIGIVSTFLIFWSLSGFVLKLIQIRKSIYLKGTNLFVLRQIHNKINTTVVSMTIICLLLFMTISVLSSALSLNSVLTRDLEEMTPVDINLYKTANLPQNETYSDAQVQDSKLPISETLKANEVDMSVLKDVLEVTTYATSELTWADTFEAIYDEVKTQFPMLQYETPEELIKLSDYNAIARAYGIPEYELAEDEFIVLCDFDNMKNLRNIALEYDNSITIAGKEYQSKYKECQTGYILMSNSHINTGVIIVPDSCDLSDDMKYTHYLIANYNVNKEEDKQEIEEIFTDNGDDSSVLYRNLNKKGIELDGMTKISLTESSKGLGVILTFIAIYLGVIFLIASSAILALKELTENSDNRQRYTVLRKIGVDEAMLHQTLFRQIGVFFLAPLALAIVHSVFGIQFALKLISVQVEPAEMLPSVIATVVFLVAVYGGYFLATYMGSKNIIKEG